MTGTEVLALVVSIVCPVGSLLIALVTSRRNAARSDRNEGEEKGTMLSDIGYIKSSTDRIERRIDQLDRKQDEQGQRLVTVEAKLDAHLKDKNAHNYKGGK